MAKPFTFLVWVLVGAGGPRYLELDVWIPASVVLLLLLDIFGNRQSIGPSSPHRNHHLFGTRLMG